MHLIDNGTQGGTSVPTPHAASGTPGYAYNSLPGAGPVTVLDADVFNTLLAELLAILTEASISPDRTNNGQILVALHKLFGGTGSLGTTGYMTLPFGLIAQWGGFSGTTGSLSGAGVAENAAISVTFPVTFPTAVYRVFVSAADVSGSSLQETAWYSGYTTSGMSVGLSCRQATTAMSGSYLVIGN